MGSIGEPAAKHEKEKGYFRPAGTDHAIVNMIVGIDLTKPWGEERGKGIDKEHHRWRELLPGVETAEDAVVIRQGMIVLQDGRPLIPEMNLMKPRRFSRSNTAGAMEWQMVIAAGRIEIHCTRYTSWATTGGIVKRLLAQIADAAKEESDEIKAIELIYQDQFVWEGPDEGYDTRKLFREGSSDMTERSFAQGPLWHLHQGWMVKPVDALTEEGLLEKIEISGLLVDGAGGEKKPAVITTTTTRLGHGNENPIARLQIAFNKLQPVREDRRTGSSRLDFLHDRNKALFGSILTREMRERINLGGGRTT